MFNSGGHFKSRRNLMTVFLPATGGAATSSTTGSNGIPLPNTRIVGEIKLSSIQYAHPYYACQASPETAAYYINAEGGLTVGDYIYTSVTLTTKKYSSNPLTGANVLYLENYDGKIYAVDFNTNGSIKTIYDCLTVTAPTPTYTITPSVTSINEGQSVTYSITTKWVDNGTMLYWTNSGTTTGLDFTQGVNSGAITISTDANYNGTGSFTLTAANDSLTEGSQTIIARLRNVSTSGTIVATASTVTVVDTSQAPTYAISSNVTSINEGESVTYTVTTTNVANGTVLYWSNNPDFPAASGGTSINDFTQQVMSGTVTINNNTGSFVLTANMDRFTELAQEQIKINLRTGSTSGTIRATAASVYINDTSKDPFIMVDSEVATIQEPGVLTFNITSHSIDPGTTVTWTNTGTSTAADFIENVTTGTTTLDANGNATVTLTVKDENVIEANETVVFNVSAPTVFGTATDSTTVTITNAGQTFDIQASDYQINEGESTTFTISTTDVPVGTVLHWENIGTTVPADFTTPTTDTGLLEINASGQASITFTAAEDALTEGAQTITLRIRRTNASGELLVSSNPVQVNDTSLTRTYSVSPSATTINEGGTITYTVTTTNVPNNTTLYYSNDGTTTGSDFTTGIDTGSVLINNNTGSFTMTLSNDALTEGSQTVIVKLRTGNVNGTIVATASTVTVNDTSTTPTYAISPNVTSINEGESVTYTVTTTNVANGTVLYWSNNPSVPSGSGGTSINDFTPQVMSGSVTINNNTASFTLTANMDRFTELAQEEIAIKLRTGSTSGTVLATSALVYINDTSQTPWINVTPNVITIQEPGVLTFSITSHSIDPGTIVTWTNTGTTVAADFIENVTTGTTTLDANGNATVTLTVKDENVIEANETIVFNVSAPTVFGTTVTDSTTVTVTNAAPSYSVTPDKLTMYEGESVTFAITTTDLPNNTTLYWVNEGTTSAHDFTQNVTQGTVVINNGTASVTLNTRYNNVESIETIVFRLKTISYTAGTVATAPTVQVYDSVATVVPNKTAMNEGDSVTYTINTNNVPNGTTWYWNFVIDTLNPGIVSSHDFLEGSNGSFVINNNTATVTLNSVFNAENESNETIWFRTYEDSAMNSLTASADGVLLRNSTFTITPNVTTINEGGTVTYTVNTTNVSNNTTLYYDNNGTTSGADFDTTVDTGSVVINNNTGTFSLTLANDFTTEGSETIIVRLREGNVNGNILKTAATVTVNDTSVTPPTYDTLTVNSTSVNEGGTVTYTLNTSNVPNGTTLYWTNSGTSTAADFYPAANSGSFVVNNNTATISLDVYNDTLTEGSQTLIFKVRTGSIAGTVVKTAPTVIINDTSLSPIWYAKYVGCLDSANVLSLSHGANAWPDTFEYEGICYSYDSDINYAANGSLTNILTAGTAYDNCAACISEWQAPTYAVTANNSVNEGTNIVFTISTSNVVNGTVLYWTNGGTTGSADMSGAINSGTVTINSNTGTVTMLPYNDTTTEGLENIIFQLRVGGSTGTIVATKTVTVNDTSTTPVVGGCNTYTLLNEGGTSGTITYTTCGAKPKSTTFTLTPGSSGTTLCTDISGVTLPPAWSIVTSTPC